MRTYIYRNVCDFDLKSAYPNIMGAFNILKTTTYGRIITIKREKDYGQGIKGVMTVGNGVEFNKMLETIDTSIFDMGKQYFGLPTPTEIIEAIEAKANALTQERLKLQKED